MDQANSRIVVVGAGQAAASLVAKLRNLGHQGPVTLIGAEPVFPYQRPTLSKGYLKGELSRERLHLRPESFYQENNIEVLTGQDVRAIDREAGEVLLAGGERLAYDILALTTGSVPRRLSPEQGGDLAGVLTMRSLADADALAALLGGGQQRAVIVGGGYIGLEAAAVLREKGLEVIVLEAAPRILARVASAETADYFRNLHERHGTEIRENAALDHLTDERGQVSGAVLTDGTILPADIVLVGIGITPEIRLAQDAGLTIDNGICVDAFGRTSDPAIYAAGDCCSFPHGDGRIRLESVPNAIDQGENVAANMLSRETPYVATPWFWSDQFDVMLQIAGLNTGYDRIITRSGTRPESVSFWYYAGDKLLAVDAMNDSRAYMIARRLIEAGVSPDPEVVRDPDTNLKKLL